MGDSDGSFNIKDALGLSEPASKLIETCSRGIGKLFRPYLLRKEADAQAYIIGKVSEAIKENQTLLQSIEYNRNGLTVISNQNSTPSLSDRVESRINFIEEKRQNNVESVIKNAFETIRNENVVSSEGVDEDWTNKFFRYAEDISSDEMQKLWGRILASEVKQPKSFSIRTLDVIRNLTQYEAELFIHVSRYIIESESYNFILLPRNQNSPFLYDSFKDVSMDIARLTDCGLFRSSPSILQFHFKPENNTKYFAFSNLNVEVNLKTGKAPCQINLLGQCLTSNAVEIMRMLALYKADKLYAETLIRNFPSQNFELKATNLRSRTYIAVNQEEIFKGNATYEDFKANAITRI